MADETLATDILDRLAAAAQRDEVVDLVLAAIGGADELDSILQGRKSPRPERTDAVPSERDAAVDGATLTSISVTGFRGIGPAATLPIQPGAGLTVIHGGNGTGKSSFAEAVEIALTGTGHRFTRGGGKVWRDGWRNLHSPEPPRVSVGLQIPGHRGESTITRTWAGDDVTASEATVQHTGEAAQPLSALSWEAPLSAMRPFCASAEIEALIEQSPTELYDRLSDILGLDLLVSGVTALKDAAAPLKERIKACDTAKKAAKDAAAALDDPRAKQAAAALRKHNVPLDELESLCRGRGAGRADVAQLLVLAELGAPDLDEVASVTAELRTAGVELVAVDDDGHRSAKATVDVLRSAIAWYDQTKSPFCPVCATPAFLLDDTWRASATSLIESVEAHAHALTQAEQRWASSVGVLREMTKLPQIPQETPVDASVLHGQWSDWHELVAADIAPSDAERIADELDAGALALGETLAVVASAAQAEYDAQEADWRAAADLISAYVDSARSLDGADQRHKDLEDARKWLSEAHQAIQNDRLAVVRDQACAYWDKLRQQSSVELNGWELTSSGPRRHVSFDVVIDGIKSQALGVMSQGELNSLALSIFLPRASQQGSPFKFVVIDDPVQAMDPAKVNGLAHVLHELSLERQVVVFTHDLRLIDALEHLRIPATVLEVTRSAGSAVQVRTMSDPVTMYLSDARAVCKDEEIPAEVIRRVVPNLCRQALEAAFAARYRRDQLSLGVHHDEIEAALRAAEGTHAKAALALCGGADQTADVFSVINRKFKRAAGDVFALTKKYGHIGCEHESQARAMIDPVEQLCAELLR